MAWRHERIVEMGLQAEREPVEAPMRLAFTFSHLPVELTGDGRDVVLVTIGAMS